MLRARFGLRADNARWAQPYGRVVAGGYSNIWIGALLAVVFVLSLLSERVLPFEQSWKHVHSDLPKDVVMVFVYELSNINALSISIDSSRWVIVGRHLAHHSAPGVQLFLAIIIADFSMTMISYYLSYRMTWLWCFTRSIMVCTASTASMVWYATHYTS